MIERIEHAGIMLALIIRAEFRKEGIEFFTPGERLETGDHRPETIDRRP
jgi:hypothetical protein